MYARLETAIEQGIGLGEANAMLRIAKLMKSNNECIEKIAVYTGLSASEIELL